MAAIQSEDDGSIHFGAQAEFQRDCIGERPRAGLAAADVRRSRTLPGTALAGAIETGIPGGRRSVETRWVADDPTRPFEDRGHQSRQDVRAGCPANAAVTYCLFGHPAAGGGALHLPLVRLSRHVADCRVGVHEDALSSLSALCACCPAITGFLQQRYGTPTGRGRHRTIVGFGLRRSRGGRPTTVVRRMRAE